LMSLELDENHCRVLGDHSRPGLEIELDCCAIRGSGARALAEVLGRNQGPTKLDQRFMGDYSILADGLRGNSRLKNLKLEFYFDNSNRDGNQELIAIASALQENKGLVNLHLVHAFTMSEETWDAVFDSLKAHPTIQVLTLQPKFLVAPPLPAVLKSRVQALVDMLEVNISMHTIDLPDYYRQHEIFRESVMPYLETNRFRPCLLAIQKTRPIAYRTGVLGRALLSARADANKRWMLLSGNAEVVIPSATATTTLAITSFPTPDTTGTPPAC
jgi:hypothetical protein